MAERFPNIDELAAELDDLRRYLSEENDYTLDVRLQVVDGDWSLNWGDPGFDQDHRGFWGCGVLDAEVNVCELAEQLIDEAREDYEERRAAAWSEAISDTDGKEQDGDEIPW